MIEVIPGIKDFELSAIERKLALVAPHVSWVHFDISDDSFIKGNTYLDFEKLAPLVKSYPKLLFEVHMMVARPEKYVKAIVDAGFARIIAHIEGDDPRLFLDEVKFESIEVGLALDGTSEIEQIEPYLEEIDCVTVHTSEVSLEPQEFLPETIEKIKLIHDNYPDVTIEASGGITDQTARLAIEAGATRLVSESYLFENIADIARTIKVLRGE